MSTSPDPAAAPGPPSFRSILENVQLVWRLLQDDRVSTLLKVAIPLAVAVYFISPLDILPDFLPIVGLTVLPIVFGWPLILMPIHIAFLHLVIDPACSVVFEAEPEQRDIMRRPPRALDERLFGRRVLIPSMALGTTLTTVLVATFAAAAQTRSEITLAPRVTDAPAGAHAAASRADPASPWTPSSP